MYPHYMLGSEPIDDGFETGRIEDGGVPEGDEEMPPELAAPDAEDDDDPEIGHVEPEGDEDAGADDDEFEDE